MARVYASPYVGPSFPYCGAMFYSDDKVSGAWLGFVNAVQSLGALSLYPVVAWSNNRFGRKKTIGVGYFWLALGATVQTAANSPAMFVCGRLFIGGVSAFFSAAAPILITETAYPTHRAMFTALFNCGWYVGSLLAAWATFGTRNYTDSWAWRIPSLLQILIPIVAFSGYIMAPESPRWLAAMDRPDEARAFLVKYHAGGDESSPLADYELEDITRTLALEAQFKRNSSYRDMIRTKGNVHRTFISISLGLFAQWNGVGVASYYLAPVLATVGVTSVTQQTMISGFLQIWNLILAVSSALSVDRLGRRMLFLTSCLGMLASYVAISGLSGSFAATGHASTGIAVIPFLFIYYGFYDIAFTPLIVSYVCEIWPYSLRARGLSTTLLTTQAAVFFNIFVNPIALEAIQWKYYIVYCVILVVITVTIYFFYPETKGHSLEAMASVFDGKDAAIPEEGKIRESVERRGSGAVAQEIKSNDITHIEKMSL
jgi:sugar porter (SP) family MFS transporter